MEQKADHVRTERAIHEHYNHYSAIMIKRLDGFFGRVDQRINERIAAHVVGSSILDVGCGFGSLVDYMRRKECEAIGIDMLEACIAAGCLRYPKADLRLSVSDALQFPNKSFDTVILKDTIHHVFEESNIQTFLTEVRRVCRKRVILWDPNPIPALLLARRLIHHTDPVCSPQQAYKAVTKAGFVPVHLEFWEMIAFPLSGGYVGYPMDFSKTMENVVLCADRLLNRTLQTLRLAKYFCWRYLLVADLKS